MMGLRPLHRATILLAVALGSLPAAAVAEEPILVLATDRLAALDRSEAAFGRDVHVEVLRLPAARMDDALGVLGPEPVFFCPVASEDVAEFEAAIADAQTQLDELNVGAARGTLAGLEIALTCLNVAPENELLWRLHFLHALLASVENDPGAANDAMRRALVARPGEPYDPSYPPELGDRYRTLQEAVLAAEHANLHIQSSPGWTLWVDGRRSTSEAVPLVPGRHLIQLRTSAGLRGFFLDVNPADEVLIAPPNNLAGLAQALSRDDRAALGAQLIARLGRPAETQLWFDDGNKTVRLSGRASRSGGAPAAFTAHRRLKLALGGGYLRTGDWSYGSIALDVSLGLAGPLRLALYARPSIGEPGRYTSGTGDPVRPVLTPFGLAVEVELSLPVRPRFGIGLQLGANPDGTDVASTFLVGVHGRVGLDIPLGDIMAIRVQGELGNMETFFTASALAQLVVGLVPQAR